MVAGAEPRRLPAAQDLELERAALRDARIQAALRHAQAHRNSGNVGPSFLQDLLGYVERLERAFVRQRQAWQDFEAEAEGEFCELRLQRRAWQDYAGALERPWDDPEVVVDHVLACLQDLAVSPWWAWRARHRARVSLRHWRRVTVEILEQSGPEAPRSPKEPSDA